MNTMTKYSEFFTPEEEAEFWAMVAAENEAENAEIRAEGGMTESDFYDPFGSDDEEEYEDDDPVRNGWVDSNGLP